MNTETQVDTVQLSAAAATMVVAAAESLGAALNSPVELELTGVTAKDAAVAARAPAAVSVDIEWRGSITGNSSLFLAESAAKAIAAAADGLESESIELASENANTALTQAIAELTKGAADAVSDAIGEQIALSPSPIAIDPGPHPEDPASFDITFAGQIAGQAGADIVWEIDSGIAGALSGRWPARAVPEPVAEELPAPPPSASSTPPPAPVSAPVPTQFKSGVIDSVELDVAVELGNVALTIGELLHLGEGSVVTLTQSVGDDVVLLANGTPVANGEVVVVDGTLGFRVSTIVTEAPGA